MFNLKQGVVVLIVSVCTSITIVHSALAQAPSDEATIFLPLVTGAETTNSNVSSTPTDADSADGETSLDADETFSADPSWARLSPTAPKVTLADQKRIEATPCGTNTVAIIHTEEHDQYVFCVNEKGDIAVIETLVDGQEVRSRLDQFYNPIDLLEAVVPSGLAVPEEVRLSLKQAKALQRETPHVLGQPDPTKAMVVNASQVSAASCSTPSLGFSPAQAFFNDYTYCGFVYASSSRSSFSGWHAHAASLLTGNNEGSHQHAGPHRPPHEYYYADEDEEGDARYGRARVQSCGGTTMLRGWSKSSPTTGNWSLFATFYVPIGSVTTMAWYSNAQRSLWMGYDADDISFRVDTLDSVTSFGSLFYFLKYAYGPNCDLKY
jgi:hypothetical protein